MNADPQSLASKIIVMSEMPLMEKVGCFFSSLDATERAASRVGGIHVDDYRSTVVQGMSNARERQLVLTRLRKLYKDPDKQSIIREIIGSAYGETTMKDFAREIKAAARFTLDDTVVRAVAKMCTRNNGDVIQSYQHAHPPFDQIWVEFKHDIFPEFQEGFLVKRSEDRLHLWRANGGRGQKGFFANADYRMAAVFNGESIALARVLEDGKLVAPQENVESKNLDIFARVAMVAINVFMLMNSRSRVLEHGKTSRGRGQMRYVDPVGSTPLRFDLSRMIAKGQGQVSEEQAKQMMAEALVRGHFKVRKTGVFWWSPYVRNKRDDVPVEQAWSEQLGRDRVDHIMHPHRELEHPKMGSTGPAFGNNM